MTSRIFTASHGSNDTLPTPIQIRAPFTSRPITGNSGETSSSSPSSAHVHLKRDSALISRGMRIVAANAPAAMNVHES
jgi:hypothetical protein